MNKHNRHFCASRCFGHQNDVLHVDLSNCQQFPICINFSINYVFEVVQCSCIVRGVIVIGMFLVAGVKNWLVKISQYGN